MAGLLMMGCPCKSITYLTLGASADTRTPLHDTVEPVQLPAEQSRFHVSIWTIYKAPFACSESVFPGKNYKDRPHDCGSSNLLPT